MHDKLKDFFRSFVIIFVIFTLSIPVTITVISLFSETVYAQKKKERRKPPKAKRTETMSKKVGAEFIKAQEALGDDLPDRAMGILNNLLRRDDLRPFESAQIVRLQAYVYAEKEDYVKCLELLERVYSLNALQPQDQLDLQFQISQLYLAVDKWVTGHEKLLKWFNDAEELGLPAGPSAHALLAQIYLYFASETEKDSPEEKQYYRKAEPHAEKAVFASAEPRENWYQVYLSILLFDDRYEESVPILEAMTYRFPEKKNYYRQLAALYAELKREEDSFYVQQIMHNKEMLEKHDELLRIAQL